MSDVPCALTLGHDDLTTSPDEARFLIADILHNYGAAVMAVAIDGTGVWVDTEDSEHVEATDVWVFTVNEASLSTLRRDLAACARVWGQEALGFLVHDESRYGPSYLCPSDYDQEDI